MNSQANYKEQYQEDIKLYSSIVTRYRNLKENDIMGAYNLMKDSHIVSERWSVIREEYRKLLRRGEKSEEKDRLEDMYSLQKGLYVREEVIRQCMGGRLIIEEDNNGRVKI